MINSDNGTEIVYRIPYSSDIIIVKIAARNKAARKRGKFPQLICMFLNLTMLLAICISLFVYYLVIDMIIGRGRAPVRGYYKMNSRSFKRQNKIVQSG